MVGAKGGASAADARQLTADWTPRGSLAEVRRSTRPRRVTAPISDSTQVGGRKPIGCPPASRARTSPHGGRADPAGHALAARTRPEELGDKGSRAGTDTVSPAPATRPEPRVRAAARYALECERAARARPATRNTPAAPTSSTPASPPGPPPRTGRRRSKRRGRRHAEVVLVQAGRRNASRDRQNSPGAGRSRRAHVA